MSVRGGEVAPGDDGAEVDEHGGVEEEVEDLGQFGLARLHGEPAVRGEAVAGAEGDEEVVDAEGGADADGEEGEEEVEDEEGRFADVVAAGDEAEGAVEAEADEEADEDAEGALPEDGAEDPFREGALGALLDEEVDAEVEEGEADAVVAAAFGAEHVSQPAGHPFRETALGEHASCQDWVGGCQTRADDEGGLEVCA